MRRPKLSLLISLMRRGAHPVLARVSSGCPGHRGRLPTCYSPVRGSAPGRSPGSSLHLHVLSTPPAFVLSQDQTLREELHDECQLHSRATAVHKSVPSAVRFVLLGTAYTLRCSSNLTGSEFWPPATPMSGDAADRTWTRLRRLEDEPSGAHAVEFSKTAAPLRQGIPPKSRRSPAAAITEAGTWRSSAPRSGRRTPGGPMRRDSSRRGRCERHLGTRECSDRRRRSVSPRPAPQARVKRRLPSWSTRAVELARRQVERSPPAARRRASRRPARACAAPPSASRRSASAISCGQVDRVAVRRARRLLDLLGQLALDEHAVEVLPRPRRPPPRRGSAPRARARARAWRRAGRASAGGGRAEQQLVPLGHQPRPGSRSVLPYISSGGSVIPIVVAERLRHLRARRRCPSAAASSGRPAAAARRPSGAPGPSAG